MRVDLQPGYVLHARPYRETSQLLELVTREFGRVGVVARGVRRRGGGLQPFRPLLVSWSGRGELRTLVASEGAGSPLGLNGRALLNGFYLNEVMMRLTHRDDPNPGAFEAYHRALVALAGPAPAEATLRVFEKRLLEALGYGLVLDRESATGAPLTPGVRYRYRLEHGPEALAGEAGEAPGTVSGATLLALARESLESRVELVEAKALMRPIMAFYLGPKPLASRALFR